MKRISFIATTLSAALLAGCTDVAMLRSSSPTASYAGNNPVGDVVSCVGDAWSRKPVHLSTITVSGGSSIQLQQDADGPVVALVDIKAMGSQTAANYFSKFPGDDSWYFEQVRYCMSASATPG